MIEEILFKLLRIGLEISNPTEEDLEIFARMSEKDWADLMNIAQKQGVLGFAFDGLEKIDSIITIKHDAWFFEAYNRTLLRESFNIRQRKIIEELSILWKDKGIQMLLLKGQANGLYYPKPLHRDSGDIDCYLFGQYKKGNDVIKTKGIDIDEKWDKHSKFLFKGETIENHQFFVKTLDSKWWKALHEDLTSLIDLNTLKCLDSKVYIPSVQFNALFLTYHAMEHFTMGNLRLKQIVDWAMFVKSSNNSIDWMQLHSLCDKYNMITFLKILNKIVLSKLNIKISDASNMLDKDGLICKVLNTVFNDNDYIWGELSKGRWTGRIHYLTYVIRNKWKFNIAGRSIAKQLWLYAITYSERNK